MGSVEGGGGGGGGAACLAGGGGARPTELDGLAVDVAGACRIRGAGAGAAALFPGRGRAVGFGLETTLGFYIENECN